MSHRTTYQAARAVAPAIEQHFASLLEEARQQDAQDLAHGPQAEVIEALANAAFWASLLHEEGLSPKISIAYLSPEQSPQPLLFEKPFTLTPGILTKLAPAVERPGIHLGVWQNGDKLQLWGATRLIPSLCFVLEVIEPGLLVVKHRRLDGLGKFVNVAVLRGEEVKIVDENSGSQPDCPNLLSSLLGLSTAASWSDSVNVLVQLAISMRDHGRGGTLLVVPAGTTAWRKSIMHPITYSVAPAYAALTDLMRQEKSDRKGSAWQDTLRRAIDGVAGLTAVDGATIISDSYELLAFGAKIGRPEGSAPVSQITMTEPIVGGEAVVTNPALHGGTRHLSAAQFVHDQRDALALVASQDGRFTIFAWSPCENMVHAHRIDSLLL
ncbi:putative sensor domain DACNV-containing protein [Pontibacter sp. 13R65]|uniref:putative sensor domain DACNV-containing protein n=1 Tax=Pontibacter sp. 13R65 TaxID=3127458 RepID=UPI00301DAEF6